MPFRLSTVVFYISYTILLIPTQSAGDENEIEQIEASIITAVAKAQRSIVAIGRRKKTDADDTAITLVGTGICVDPTGKIITHYDVLGEIRKFDYFVWVPRLDQLEQNQSRQVTAIVLAADPWTNLACIKAETNNLTAIEFADSAKIKKGQLAISIGGTHCIAEAGTPCAGWGIVSNLNLPAPMPLEAEPEAESRPTQHHYGTLVQVDTRINCDVHGSALINRKGKLIGLLTAHAASPQLAHPAGLAIPVNDVFIHAIDSLKTGKRPSYGLFGVQPRDLSQDKIESGASGIQIVEVIPNTPAAVAGLRFGDLILRIDGIEISSSLQMTRMLSGLPSGTEVSVDIQRLEPDGSWIDKSIAVLLAKKYVAFARTGYPEFDYPQWHGIQFDEPTAVEKLQDKSDQIDNEGCIAVVKVWRDSIAWNAGLRHGVFVSHVNEKRVSFPSQLSILEFKPGDEVRLTLTDEKKSVIVFNIPDK